MQHFTYKYWSTTQTKGGLILETLEKKPQKTLNHKNPKSHISFSSLPEQPLTAPVKKFRENRGGRKTPFPCSQRPAAPPFPLVFPIFSPPLTDHLHQQPTDLSSANRTSPLKPAPSPHSRCPSPSLIISFGRQQTQLIASDSLHHLLRRRFQLLHQAQRQPPLSSSPPISINAGSTRSQQQSRSPSPQTHGSRFNQRVFPSSAAEQPPAAATNPAAATDSPPASGAARSGT